MISNVRIGIKKEGKYTFMIEDYDTMKVFNNKYIGNETDLGESAAGKLHKYANLSLIEQEKDAWRKAAIKKHAEE